MLKINCNHWVLQVKTWKMHLFTVIQFAGLGVLWAVKSVPQIALAFPFFVASMTGLRWSLKYVFTEKELEHVRNQFFDAFSCLKIFFNIKIHSY